jgi:hypothetical protein
MTATPDEFALLLFSFVEVQVFEYGVQQVSRCRGVEPRKREWDTPRPRL